MPDVKLQAILTLKDSMTGNLNGAKKSLEGFSKIALAAGATFVAAIGVKSVKAAADFEQAMSDVSTLMRGDSAEAIGQFEEGIKDLMKRVPKSAEELGASAYAIVSAGFSDASDALEVLEQSARLAVGGLGTTEEATTLLTVAMNAFKHQGLSANETADVLFKTVNYGITTVADLSQAFGKMAGGAVSAGISIEEASAATSALSSITGKTSESQNQLYQMFAELTQQGGKLDAQLQKNGGSLEMMNARISEKGLLGGMQAVKEELGLTDTEFKNLFSSQEAGSAAFQLLTSGADTYRTALEDMENGVNAVDEAFNKQNETAKAQYELLKNNLNVALIELGNAILPMLIQIMPHVIKFVDDLVGGFRELADIVRSVSQTVSNFRSNVSGGFGEVRSLVETGRFRASGGDVQAGQSYIVGERGAEMFVPNHSGTIVPNNQMGGGSITVNFNNPTVRSDADLQTIVNVVRQTLNRDLTLEQIGV